MRLSLFTSVLLSACVAQVDAPTWCDVPDQDTCDALLGEMCRADNCTVWDGADFCVTGDAASEAQNGRGDPDGDGFRVVDFTWQEVCDE